MARKRRRDLALAVVAVSLIGTATWRIRSADPSLAADPAGVAPAAAARPQLRDKNPMPEIDLQALRADRPEPEDSTRNPFRFRARPVPPPPPPTPAQMKPQTGPVVATGPVEPPPPPRIPLKFIGLMTSAQDQKAGPVAILSDTHGVYYGREGETVEGRYRILKIGVESIELAYLDGRGRQTIRQTGQ